LGTINNPSFSNYHGDNYVGVFLTHPSGSIILVGVIYNYVCIVHVYLLKMYSIKSIEQKFLRDTLEI
jgi:hypothetical protein